MATATTRRVRLDLLLVERGLADSRARAQALVLAGQVRVGEGDAARADLKAGDLVANDAPVAVDGGSRWVSRGAHKLVAALDAFGIDSTGLIAIDVGASTGGFTDVLLDAGRGRVYALDVGYGQLAERLRQDRGWSRWSGSTPGRWRPHAAGAGDLAVVDVSFISLGLVLGPIRSVLRDGRGPIVALVKPQFEAGRAEAKGASCGPAVHRRVIGEVAAAPPSSARTRGVIASPIQGPEGNREFLVHLGAGPSCAELDQRIDEAVAAAWARRGGSA